ncbi:hypothetical protein A0O34_00575 [Chryseobacterium glaciei]|uniref:DUF4440 domain-containing protein n=1 Tax=Chryseobacterium glaciei TaxID=1685010 RepID=A0A172XQC0_9FLAO|nr:nuclear transport factor 2 family protein [Chryseobacterium glaciei]ANF49141.1 hypothetical protein A0O34_00575 [Chryseobacterium glaciei]
MNFKSFQFILTLSLIFITTSVSFGQSKDEVEIRRLEKLWTTLLDKGDTVSLASIWSKDYVVNNPNGKIVTPSDIIKLMKEGHKFPLVERYIEKITFNENVAIVMGKEMQQPSENIKNVDNWLPRRFTNVWIKKGKNWQLAARQSTEISVSK